MEHIVAAWCEHSISYILASYSYTIAMVQNVKKEQLWLTALVPTELWLVKCMTSKNVHDGFDKFLAK